LKEISKLDKKVSKNWKEFSERVEGLHNALVEAIEEVEEDFELGHTELMCALSGLLCGVAVDGGISHEDFLTAMSMHFAARDEIPPRENFH